jgi:hypothetical protein
MAPRQVLTPAGEKHFNKPVGSEIGKGSEVLPEPRPVTFVRLQSLQRQIQKADKTGNQDLRKTLKLKFIEELRVFSEGKTSSEVTAILSREATGKSDG